MSDDTSTQILGYALLKEFETASSKSFWLISASNSLARGRTVGWIDVHYPCKGHIKVRIKAAMPRPMDNDLQAIEELVSAIFRMLEIEESETYEIDVFTVANEIGMSQRTDRGGQTDAIMTTRKYASPPRETPQP